MVKWIINSLLDQDLYKLTVGQFFFKYFRDSVAVYKFKCRSGHNLSKYLARIKSEIKHLEELRFTPDELQYLRNLNLFTEEYLEFLRFDFVFLPDNEVKLSVNNHGELEITIEGGLLFASMYEIFVLAIVQEVYGEDINIIRETVGDNKVDFNTSVYKTCLKSSVIKDNNLNVIEFGTRRRHSFAWQDRVIGIMRNDLKGTSNMYFAKKYDLPCIGTMPHELYQACQAAKGTVRLKDFQKYALRKWHALYGKVLAVALTDIVGMDAFLQDFDYMAMNDGYRGCRHDSGDPLVWVDKLINHYIENDIDPTTKLAVFSDGLDVGKALEIEDYCKGRIMTSYGIGTNLTNDVGYQPLQIVIKMISCDGSPTAKISDSPGKGMCESVAFINHLKELFS